MNGPSISFRVTMGWCPLLSELWQRSPKTHLTQETEIIFFNLLFFFHAGSYFPDQGSTHAPCSGSTEPNHWTAREFPEIIIFFKPGGIVTAVSGRFASGPLSPSVKTVQRKRSWQSNITALTSHRRLNLGEEQDVPL